MKASLLLLARAGKLHCVRDRNAILVLGILSRSPVGIY